MSQQAFANLIGAFLGDATPQRNQYFKTDEWGNPVGTDPKTGQIVTTPYNTPGFWTKVAHPDVAQYEAAQNNQFLDIVNQAHIQAGIHKNDWINRVYKNNPSINTLYGPEEAYAKFGGQSEVNNTTINPVTEAEAFAKGNGPQTAATNNILGLNLSNARRTADLANNLPAAQSKAELAQNNYNAANAIGQQGILGSRLANEEEQIASERKIRPFGEKLQIANSLEGTREAQRQLDNADTYDAIAKNKALTGLSDSGVEQQLAYDRAGQLPVLKDIQQAQLLGQQFTANHQGFPAEPFFIDNKDWKTPVVNPGYMNFGNQLNVKMGGINGSSSPNTSVALSARLPDGTPLVGKGGPQKANITPTPVSQPKMISTDEYNKAMNRWVNYGASNDIGQRKRDALGIITKMLAQKIGIPKNYDPLANRLREGANPVYYTDPGSALLSAVENGESHGFTREGVQKAFDALPPEDKSEIYNEVLKELGLLNSLPNNQPQAQQTAPVAHQPIIASSPWE